MIAPSPELIRYGFSSKVVLPWNVQKGGVLAIGEAPGALEDQYGIPFHPEAEAGGLFTRLLARINVPRERFTITNCVWQRPPNNDLSGFSYETTALDYWRPHLQKLIEDMRPGVILALGGTALQALTHFTEITTTRGYVHHLDVEFPCPVLATYHPSFLNHGMQHLSGVFIHDVLQALELAEKGWTVPRLKTTPMPSPEAFEAFSRIYNPEVHKLTYDIETPESQGVDEDVVEDDLGGERISFNIVRASFCFDSEVGGYSIPWQEPFITIAKRMLASNGPKRAWNGRLFDRPRLEKYGCRVNGREYDLLDQWRHMHRTLPARLAFVAPFYLRISPWKYLSHYQPEWYSAMDAIVEHECAEGMERDLRQMGQWETYEKHVVDMLGEGGVCTLMSRNGLPYSEQRAVEFGKELEAKRQEREVRLQELVPEQLKPVKQKQGLKRVPKDLTGYVQRMFEIKPAEAAKGEPFVPQTNGNVKVMRWALLEPFNPSSPVQVKQLIKHFGHKPGTDRKSKNETSNDDTLRKLITTHMESKKASDQIAVECYRNIREVRAIGKVLGTYVMGWKPGPDGRIHATPGVWGDMFRISWRDPNIAATVADKKEQQIAAGFRTCVAVGDDEWLIESDWKGMEAVLVGYFAEDPDYMRLARLGVHDFMALHMLKMPVDISTSDGELKDRFTWVKKNHPKVRDDAKHTVHGTNYLMTPFLMAELYEMARSRAKYLQDFYYGLFPKIKLWQDRTIMQAHKETRLINAWGYRMPFWNVFKWEQRRYERLRGLWVRYKTSSTPLRIKRELDDVKRIMAGVDSGLSEDKAIRRLCWSHGDEAKSAVSFLPRDSGAAMLKDALWELEREYRMASQGFLRGCAHDSIVAVARTRDVDWVVECLREAQERPVARLNGLVIGVETAIGKNWSKATMREYVPVTEVLAGGVTPAAEGATDRCEVNA